MDQRPKYKTRNHKLLEENIGRTLCVINHSNIYIFLDLSPKAKRIKAKINLIKIKSVFIRGKETNDKMKRQPTE